jgi:hypothetical protein
MQLIFVTVNHFTSNTLLKTGFTDSTDTMKHIIRTFLTIILITTTVNSGAQSAADRLVAYPRPDRTVYFNLSDSGVPTPIIWGLDTAWPSEDNIRRGVAFMGSEHISVVRASFQPTLPLLNDDLQTEQVNWLNTRMNLVNLTGTHTRVALNCDHPSVHEWYRGNAANWAKLMDVTTRRVQERGRTVVSIAPFNEPDYTATGQGTITDFFNIAGELRKNPRFDNIRISGGNTLNTDQALPWYNNLKSRLDEGNTHQLAGSFDNYANFFQTVRANGHHATNDELHNVMEAMVGVHYGMQTGIWWGTAEYARGEFVKASFGNRLGYAEHRPNWTAASVYRHPNGKVQAFGGASERQATNTTFRFFSKDSDVYYDGHGPQREFMLTMPGGTGYQQGQPNAERVINISRGDDIQPVINGQYILVNRNSGKVMEVAGGSTAAGTNVRQNANLGQTYQQWNVIPVDSRIGGDFSYFTITALHSGKSLDIFNWSLSNGGNIIVWDDVKGNNQQWYLEYAGDGWFYIRSRHSAKCIEVQNASTANQANVQQRDVVGAASQQWRFIPVDAQVEFTAPAAPANLSATAGSTSVLLSWDANTETDFAGYHIYRSETPGGPYNTIARNIKTTQFTDHTVLTGKPYYYVLKAVDYALNVSQKSEEITATASGNPDLVMHLPFDGNTKDTTRHFNHSAVSGNVAYLAGKTGTNSLFLSSFNAFVQLPATVANHPEITIATWINWRGGNMWQRIFDFGNGENEYMFLTPRADDGKLRFAIKNGGTEQRLIGSAILPSLQWSHVAVTLAPGKACLYVNGVLVSESDAITISPIDLKPALNYIGRSQFSDPLLNAYIDDFRIYNHALPATEIAQLAGVISGTEAPISQGNVLNIKPIPARNQLYLEYSGDTSLRTTLSVLNISGKTLFSTEMSGSFDRSIDISQLSPGVYLLKLQNSNDNLLQRFVVR